MTLPNYYACSSCHEELYFKVRSAYHYVGKVPLGKQVAEADLLVIPCRPAWCKDCDALCPVEDIAPLRAFEDSYGAVRCGRHVEYPICSEFWNPADVPIAVERLLRWRMERRHGPRTLCCGGANYQLMDVPLPLIKHAGCEYGFISPMTVIASYCGPGQGVYSPANIHVYDSEGELIGRLTWWKPDENKWDVERAVYDPVTKE